MCGYLCSSIDNCKPTQLWRVNSKHLDITDVHNLLLPEKLKLVVHTNQLYAKQNAQLLNCSLCANQNAHMFVMCTIMCTTADQPLMDFEKCVRPYSCYMHTHNELYCIYM